MEERKTIISIKCTTCGGEARVLLGNDNNLCFECYDKVIKKNKDMTYCESCKRGIKSND